MAFIRIIPPGEGNEELEKLYRLVSGPGGQVDQVLQVHSLRPHSLQGHMGIYKSALHHSGNRVPVWFLEAIGVLVSRLNGCDYCDQHHTVGMSRLLGGSAEDYSRALNQDRPGAPFTRAEQAALAYAARLTRSPGEVEAADIEAMRQVGWSDGEILEINQAASYFAYANRTVSGLGVTTRGESLGLSPPEEEGGSAWHHD